MNIASRFLIACSLVATPAYAEVGEPTLPPGFVATPAQPDAQKLALAATFVEKAYGPYFDAARYLDSMREGMVGQASDEDGTSATSQRIPLAEAKMLVASVEPVVRRHMVLIRQAYVESAANAFSMDELQQLITFVEAPAGKRFLGYLDSMQSEALILDANEKLMIDMQPEIERFYTAMCKRRTEARIAAGNKSAKCSRA